MLVLLDDVASTETDGLLDGRAFIATTKSTRRAALQLLHSRVGDLLLLLALRQRRQATGSSR